MSIKNKVGQLVKKYGTNDPFEIAKGMGIVVRYVPLGSILGFHTRNCRVSVIHINQDAPSEQQSFICCHELGHAIYHPDVNTPFLKANTLYSNDKIELEANLFAVELLFNQEGDLPITINEATEKYGISEQLILKKLNL